MARQLWFWLWLIASAALGQQPNEAPLQVDVTKRRIVEAPAEVVVATLSDPETPPQTSEPPAKPAPADRTKRLVVEPAAEAIVRDSQPAAGTAEDNPRVEPGKVHWHKDVAAAMAAAKSSGKPVLVFHLLGELDQRFT